MRTLGLLASFFVAASLSASLSGCATYRDELVRSQQAFEQNQHERALALLRELEPDISRLATPERAQYAYLRGMTDYRIGYRADARHWLAVANAYEESSPGVLPVDWKTRTAAALEEMNGIVQADGYAALAASHARDDEPGAAPASPKKDAPAKR